MWPQFGMGSGERRWTDIEYELTVMFQGQGTMARQGHKDRHTVRRGGAGKGRAHRQSLMFL
jgi:hypothetical protein